MSATADLEALVACALQMFHGNRTRDQLTYPEQKALGDLCKSLVEQVGATPQELRRAVLAWNRRYSVPCSLKSVYTYWSQLLALAEPPQSPYKEWTRGEVYRPAPEEQARVIDMLTRRKRTA